MNFILILHILAGFTALGMAGVALATAKGETWHRRAGEVYAGAMLLVTATALILSVVQASAFLFVIAIFSFFLVFTGWRAARVHDGRPQVVDHAVGGLMALAGVAMLVIGILGLVRGASATSIILLIFGGIGLTLTLMDWRDWRRGPVVGRERIARHLSRMLAGTIATITAAVVVNLTFLPTLVAWLGPTAIITPVIVWWNIRVLRDPPKRKVR